MSTPIIDPERKFIHDISNPLGVALGMLETALESLKASGRASPEEILRLEKAMRSITKTTDLIHQRREALIEATKTAAA